MGASVRAPASLSVTSSGLFSGDDPLKHSLLLLIVQIVLILSISRLVSFVFRPLRQPRVVAEIVSGILLGPTAFGYIPGFSDTIFPKSSLNVLQTVANFGLIFFLFLVGLELDLGLLRKTGSQAMAIAIVGIVVPFLLGIPVSLQIFKEAGMKHSGGHFGLPFILFLGVALSITAFPVLARILTERKIMNTEVGQIAISAAAINDVAAWALLGLAVAVSSTGSSPLVIVWVLLAGCVYLGIMFVILRPFVHNTLAKKDPVPEFAIAITFLLLLLSSFAADMIGINVIFGAFIMGLIIPKDQPISGLLIEKTEDYISILLLPLYFTSSGLNVDLGSISNGKAVSAFLLVTTVAIAGKVVSTMVVAKFLGMGLRSSAALGFLMSTKGLVELIVLNIGLSKGVINKEVFAIMVLMALVVTIATTPMIMWIYKPARDFRPYKRRNLEATSADNKLRMLVCLYGMKNVPSMMNLVEMSKGRSHSKLFQVNALHLLEFSDRLGGVNMAEVLKASEHWNNEKDPQDDAPVLDDAIATSMRTFGQVNHIRVKVSRSESRVSSMHEDICSAARKSRANIIILPYHQHFRPDGTLQSAGTGFLHVNQAVLKESPCSVALLVDRGLGASTAVSSDVQQLYHHQILVLFFGGPDDREALLLAKRMTDHSSVKITIVQCINTCRSQRPGTLDTLKNSPKEPGPKRSSFQHRNFEWLIRWARRSLRWFRNRYGQQEKAYTESASPSPQMNDSTGLSQNDTSSPAHSSNHPTTSGNGVRITQAMDKHRDGASDDDIRVAVGKLEQDNEKNLDEKSLGRFLAAANNLPDRLTVKTLEMDALEELLTAGEHGLIIVGLHSSRPAELGDALQHKSGSQCLITDHGLGSIGNWLFSTELISIRSSLLIVWQHDRSHDESLRGEMSKMKISDDEVEHSAVDFQDSPGPCQVIEK